MSPDLQITKRHATVRPEVKKTERKHKGDVRDAIAAFGIDAICALIEEDVGESAIANKIGCSRQSLNAWINADPQHSARVRVSREQSAQDCDYKAEEVLLAIRSDSSPAEVTRARELASHYRWRAKVRNPRNYGDKQEVTAAVTVAEMTSEERQQRVNAIIARANAAAASAQ